MAETRRPSSIVVKNMVTRGIRRFEREHPDVVIDQDAKAALFAQAAEHSKAVLIRFESRKQTQRDFVNGLEQILVYAAQSARPVTKVYYRTYRVGRADEGPRSATLAHQKRAVITGQNLRLAMKKKCKTFPWC
jgi:hypothetical protein